MRLAFSAIACTMAYLLCLTASHGQTVHQADFETTFPAFGYSYGYSGFGDASCSVNMDSSDQVTHGFDVSTSPAAVGTFDTSTWMIPTDSCYNYAGFGLGIGFVLPEGQRPTTGVFADYTVTFDASVEGYTDGDDGLLTDLRILIQTPDDDDPDTSAEQHTIGADANNPGTLPAIPLLTDTPQTFTINFGELHDFGGDMDFTTSFADVFVLILQLQPSTNATEIGIDADNKVIVDNVRFTGAFASDVGLEGDYDFDADVDGDDFLVWQRGESPNPFDPADLATWQTNFGLPGAGAAVSAVPEPCSLFLTSLAGLALFAVGRTAIRA